ncbi:Transposon Ty3-I Gag-Pol polyprotein [Thelohanellus kitauei]|uniref:Transposon Ty3-I Gag-Pol polyprotein n=1 Tax=Thelohanellus kitauei TaxID=669202 RepID=A0A0C2JC41_THEKT|nr:Transposon Ty3-I Gag-Pol polyprotein [Thelohanellus kitauei]
MKKIAGDLDSVFIYLDDILIFSRSEEDNEKHLRQLFCQLSKYGILVNVEKCVFGRDCRFPRTSNFTAWFSPLPSKVDHTPKFALPTSIKRLQTFIGMVNFYRRFIPNSAQIMQALYNFIDQCSRLLEWNRLVLKDFSEIFSENS